MLGEIIVHCLNQVQIRMCAHTHTGFGELQELRKCVNNPREEIGMQLDFIGRIVRNNMMSAGLLVEMQAGSSGC